MALSIKIFGIMEKERRLWIQDFIGWWPSRELAEDPRCRLTMENPAYRDFSATLTRSEAAALADEFAPRAGSHQQAEVEQLRQRIQESSWIVPIIYEWER